ncbi:MAG: PEP-CTERM sorting domain-containing protein [Planctomycetota bacterium]|nr:PEP-CTERM sorting domain-containing protein [Planctomycetota bacterium]
MRACVAIAVLCAVAGTSAYAGAVGLSLAGTSVNWSSPSATSPTMVVSVLNPNGGETDPVVAWSLGLTVSGETGSVGTVRFAGYSTPSNYLYSLDPSGSGGISTSTFFPSTSIAGITDIANDSGVKVPSTGANLLSLTFSATSNAYGVFDVFAVPYDGVSLGSYWLDGNSAGAGFPPVSFLNAPQGGGNLLLGTITIPPPITGATPEPGTIVLLGTGGLTLVVLALRRRKGSRRSV